MALESDSALTNEEIIEKSKSLKLSFIGANVMGSALANGFISKNVVPPQNISLSNRNPNVVEKLKNKFPDSLVSSSNAVASSNSDFIFICVKPDIYQQVLEDIEIKHGAVVVSILAGVRLETLQSVIPGTPLVRIMPNAPARVQEMACGYTFSETVTNGGSKQILAYLLNAIGIAFEVEESKLDAITAVSGASPAFAFVFIEALADGGLLHGLPKDIGTKLAAKALLGAAKMVLETGSHPAVLKDQIACPGGPTIHGLEYLERKGFRGVVIGTVDAAVERSIEMADDEESDDE